MPNKFVSRADGYFDRNRRVEVVCPNGEVLVYRGRVTPTIHLFRDVLRGMAKSGNIGVDERGWAVQQLRLLGMSDTEALDEIEHIAESAVQRSRSEIS
jgi:hypothetical protein